MCNKLDYQLGNNILQDSRCSKKCWQDSSSHWGIPWQSQGCHQDSSMPRDKPQHLDYLDKNYPLDTRLNSKSCQKDSRSLLGMVSGRNYSEDSSNLQDMVVLRCFHNSILRDMLWELCCFHQGNSCLVGKVSSMNYWQDSNSLDCIRNTCNCLQDSSFLQDMVLQVSCLHRSSIQRDTPASQRQWQQKDSSSRLGTTMDWLHLRDSNILWGISHKTSCLQDSSILRDTICQLNHQQKDSSILLGMSKPRNFQSKGCRSLHRMGWQRCYPKDNKILRDTG
jgi:hypothetical protein